MGEVSFHLIGTNAFHVKAESKRFQGTTVGSRCHQNHKFSAISTTSFDRRLQKLALNYVSLVQYFSVSSFNQIESYH